MKSVDQILEDALQLPNEQKLTLAHRILELTDADTDRDVSQLWDAEIRERIGRYDRGETRSRPLGDVLADLDRKLQS